MSDTKMIRVVSRGYVFTSRGRVMSPIMCPYRESVNRIWSMITVDRADVEEKLDDGSFVPLTVQNYDKDNNIKADIATGVPVKVTKEPDENNQERLTEIKNLGAKQTFLSKTDSETPVEEHEDEVPAEDSETELTLGDEEEESEEEESAMSTNPTQNSFNNRNKKKRNRNKQNNQTSSLNNDLSVKTEAVE